GSGASSAKADNSTQPSPPAEAAPAEHASLAPSAPSGPYHFDATKGAALFSANCSACHQPTGMGLAGAFPPLKGDATVLDPNPAKQIDTVLNGLHDQKIRDTVYATPMPPFESLLTDAEIADIINHERSSWGNKSKLITADEVKARRAVAPK